jgi:predicted ferric reductase
MSLVSEQQLDDLAEKGLKTLVQVVLATAGGAILAVVVLPQIAPQMARTMEGGQGSVFWLLSRSSAMVAYVLLWGSMMLGLAITNRMARLWPGGPAAFDVHQHLSLLALGLIIFHALILLGDQYMQYSVAEILVPFASLSYRPEWVGMGQLGIYMLAIVTGSFYVRKRLGHEVWRAIHFLSFTLFILALFHGWMSGTDSGTLWAQVIYWSTGASVLLMTIYRILVLAPERARSRVPNAPEASAARSPGAD